MEPALSSQPVFSGHFVIPHGWPPVTGANVLQFELRKKSRVFSGKLADKLMFVIITLNLSFILVHIDSGILRFLKV